MSKTIQSYRRHIRINGKLQSKRFLRKTDADRWYNEQLRKKQLIESGLEEEVFSETFKSFAEKWMSSRKANGQPRSSYRQEISRMEKYLYPVFGHRILETIHTREWDQFLNSLVTGEGLSPATKNRIRSMISKLYNDAIRMAAASRNPISIIPKAKEKMKTWDYLSTQEECSRYLESAKLAGSSFYLFAYLALNTGARLGEILALENRDIDLVQRRIRIWRIYEQATNQVHERTKSNSERWLGINESLLNALTEHLRKTEFNAPGDALIVNSEGRRLDEYTMRRLHWKTCERADIRRIRIHDLRHTFASHYIMASGSLAELQGLLGHSTPMMTLKYAHLAPGYLESRASVVSFASQSERSLKVVGSK